MAYPAAAEPAALTTMAGEDGGMAAALLNWSEPALIVVVPV